MSKKIKLVDFGELKQGMVIAKDVEYNGRILLRKDVTITSISERKLKKILFLEKVEIYDENSKETTKIDQNQVGKIKKIEEEFNSISIELQRTFRILSKDENAKNCLSELKDFSNRIMDAMQPSSLIIKNIVLYGSGEDVIYRHSVNVAALSGLIGEWIGLSKTELNRLIYAAILHDVGKLKIDRQVLNKKNALTSKEYNKIKTHANLGYNILKSFTTLDKSILYGVLMHHEREDGSGYPLNLKSKDIHIFAKVIAIADVFDAINSNRGYKRKKAPFEALKIISTESMGKLNYEYCKTFIEHIIDYYLGEKVILNDGTKCKIIQMNKNDLENPLVLSDTDFIDLSTRNDLKIEKFVM